MDRTTSLFFFSLLIWTKFNTNMAVTRNRRTAAGWDCGGGRTAVTIAFSGIVWEGGPPTVPADGDRGLPSTAIGEG